MTFVIHFRGLAHPKTLTAYLSRSKRAIHTCSCAILTMTDAPSKQNVIGQ